MTCGERHILLLSETRVHKDTEEKLQTCLETVLLAWTPANAMNPFYSL